MNDYTKLDPKSIDFEKAQNLVPCVIQHYLSGKVLMLGYMNEEAFNKSQETGLVTFYSRSKQRLWTKGEDSKNYLHIRNIALDCDSDAILIQALPDGPTCHKGTESCFDTEGNPNSFLFSLENLLKQRKIERPEGSYTSKMFDKGLDKITQKVGEEAVETVIASKNDDEDEFVYEASDLLFHLMLLMVQKEIPFQSLIQELDRRHS